MREIYLQGIDYIYNVNGWLKAINNPALNGTADGFALDPGADGFGTSNFKPDAFGMELDYYTGDYIRTGGWSKNSFIQIAGSRMGTYINYGDPDQTNSSANLYNGNIRSVRWQIKDQDAFITGGPKLNNSGAHWMYAYGYDNRNWIKEAKFGKYKPDYTINRGNYLPPIHIDEIFVKRSSEYEMVTEAAEAISNTVMQDANYYNTYGPAYTEPETSDRKYANAGENQTAINDENNISYFNINKAISDVLKAFSPGDQEPDQNLLKTYFNKDKDNAFLVWDIDYDKNGNIQTLRRNAYKGAYNADMDKLTYKYDTEKKNRLLWIDDYVTPSGFDDIDDQSTGNYTYNNIGQMTGNVAGYGDKSHYFKYNVYGLVTHIYNSPAMQQSDLMAEYRYDDKGFRWFKRNYISGVVDFTTYYIRDAGGNLLMVYEQGSRGMPTREEMPVYGASRLGLYRMDATRYEYELTDHLGNVRAVVSKDGDNLEMVSISDFYPFGMEIQGRLKVPSEGQYRFDYQGQFAERDEETGYSQFEARLWDARIGRWMVCDPAGQYHNPYLGMGNNPVAFVDPQGLFIDPPTQDEIDAANGQPIYHEHNGICEVWELVDGEYLWSIELPEIGIPMPTETSMDYRNSFAFMCFGELASGKLHSGPYGPWNPDAIGFEFGASYTKNGITVSGNFGVFLSPGKSRLYGSLGGQAGFALDGPSLSIRGFAADYTDKGLMNPNSFKKHSVGEEFDMGPLLFYHSVSAKDARTLKPSKGFDTYGVGINLIPAWGGSKTGSYTWFIYEFGK